MASQDRAPVDFLYTEIGRGHPAYLDGIIECMPAERVGRVTDVFSTSSALGRAMWGLARTAYRLAGRSRAIAAVYNRLRAGHDLNRGGLAQELMGRPLRARFRADRGPLVVAHPLLVALLKERPRLVYQHGEVTVPRESRVRGSHRVIVPLTRTADRFVAAGLRPEQISVSGLCIEPGLLAHAVEAFNARLDRLARGEAPCGAFFSSGAEPRPHVATLTAAAHSAAAGGGRVIIFARRSGVLARRVAARFKSGPIDLVSVAGSGDLPGELPRALLCPYGDRRELNASTEALFPRFDYFVAPSHERTNWALGLGLPLFIVDPPLGPFAPLNREYLLEGGVARVVTDPETASRFGGRLSDLMRSRELARMAEAGWGRYETDGFRNVASWLAAL